MPKLLPNITVPYVLVEGGGIFPVRRIYCVGRNYADHAREMGSDPDREPPFFFSKPNDAVVQGHHVPYPPMTSELHHEVELVLALSSGGRDLTPEAADKAIFGYAVGVDLTRRDLQAVAKDKGRPWDLAKGFDHSAPIGRISPRETVEIGNDTRIRLEVDGVEKQSGTLGQMSWAPAEIIAKLSAYVELKAGDLIFTGTPSGVGELNVDNHVVAEIAGLSRVMFTVE